MIPAFWYRWLFAATVGVMVFGLSMVVAPELIRSSFSLLLYSSASRIETGFSADANDYIILVNGVLGSVMFGWGLAMFLILRGPFRQGNREGWLLLAVPFAAWYLTDTAFSLYVGFWQNAALNTVMAIAFIIPLAATRKLFHGNSA